MITFTRNNTFGQLYAECSSTGQSYRIPAGCVDDFLADANRTLEQVLSKPQERTAAMHSALAFYNG